MQAGQTFREQGLAALRQGDAETAVRFLTDAVRTDVVDAEAWSGLGIGLCKLGRLAEGVTALQRAIALRPDAAPLHYNLGRALELQNGLPEALQSYRKAAELDPKHAGAVEAVNRLSSSGVAPTPMPSIEEFLLAPSPPPPVGPSPVPAPPFRPAASVPPPPLPGYTLTPPLAGYSPAAPPVRYPEVGRPVAGAGPRRSGPSPWAVIGAVVGSLLLVIGGSVVLLMALLFPAMQRAREARMRVERQQQENAWRTNPAFSTAPQYTPPVYRPQFRPAPTFRPPVTPTVPETRIVIPQPRHFEIPEPPHFTPPPVPEPPRFSPPPIPSPGVYLPRTIPHGPRFQYGPPGAGTAGSPGAGAPTGATPENTPADPSSAPPASPSPG